MLLKSLSLLRGGGAFFVDRRSVKVLKPFFAYSCLKASKADGFVFMVDIMSCIGSGPPMFVLPFGGAAVPFGGAAV